MQQPTERDALLLGKQIPNTKTLGYNESRTADGKQYRTGYKFERNSEGARDALASLERLNNPEHVADGVRGEVYVVILGKIAGDRITSMDKVLSRNELQAMVGQKPNQKPNMTSARS